MRLTVHASVAAEPSASRSVAFVVGACKRRGSRRRRRRAVAAATAAITPFVSLLGMAGLRSAGLLRCILLSGSPPEHPRATDSLLPSSRGLLPSSRGRAPAPRQGVTAAGSAAASVAGRVSCLGTRQLGASSATASSSSASKSVTSSPRCDVRCEVGRQWRRWRQLEHHRHRRPHLRPRRIRTALWAKRGPLERGCVVRPRPRRRRRRLPPDMKNALRCALCSVHCAFLS